MQQSETRWSDLVSANNIPETSVILAPNGEPAASMTGGPNQSYSGSAVSRELARWNPRQQSADAAYLPNREKLTNRSQDLARNDSLISSGIQTHVDAVVGKSFKLSAKPNAKMLGLDQEQAAELSMEIEAKFSLWAESCDYWIDAEGRRTFTGIIREGVRTAVTSGEIFASAEWIPNRGKYKTAIRLIDPDRISNPHDRQDTNSLRAGVQMNAMGEASSFWVRNSHKSERSLAGSETHTWTDVPRRAPWGRELMLHVFEPLRAGQTRGINRLVSVLKSVKMLEKFSDSHLQNAILNAMYAVTVESNMDSQTIFDAIGVTNKDDLETSNLGQYMQFQDWYTNQNNLKFDGAKIVHLPPNNKLNLNRASVTADFSPFEQSFVRRMAAGFNMSYEEFSRDFTKTNFSSARAAMMQSWRYFMGMRNIVAIPLASKIYSLWLEEALDSGEIKVPKGVPGFWDAKEAWINASWIATGQPQIDGLKETKTIVLQLDTGLISLEEACAQLGRDWTEVIEQIARERKILTSLGLPAPFLGLADRILSEPPEAPEQESPGVDTNNT